ncbi:hypothetical protein CANTEDRAFT_115755 [Yamadazyma tenuis ATCC 10573]|uniref:Oxo-4-hydroxy-4-carboxy-5-ureidoimidazoline decarboxylase domain-containing protein n=1 Tax=Candida tenuis (strain ATCC 10573 / BCRC 21748 / CBS 615 / JCM 9827 / NBRC 10315 / NRRL Y-1498 / VKM Y-70) TaxID=590646 RepID=G3B7Q1_CANTC|nr:uncharacterized protein CANTEDRAFT_115755 [Yamadazyma tenuis ATCC 10573]EGV62293.1 hypothetical protein CANTEDRAFT_115755 [Yamadazyma tenuis ATCC 10573]
MYTLPDIKEVTNLSHEKQSQLLDNLFEPCPTLTAILLQTVLATSTPFSSYKQLIETSRTQLLEYLRSSEQESEKTGEIRPEIAKIISAHPRLGGAKKSKKSLQGSQEETEMLAKLNAQYEEAFPGLRYVVFVNGRSRQVIMDNMRQRIARGDIRTERREAFDAMCDIALDRASKLGAKL